MEMTGKVRGSSLGVMVGGEEEKRQRERKSE
jgi:hypothetical protein